MKKSDLKKYFAKIGRRGGRAVSAQKLEAIKNNLELAREARRKYPPCPRYKNHSHRFALSGACACGYKKETA